LWPPRCAVEDDGISAHVIGNDTAGEERALGRGEVKYVVAAR
jgi:hypothetical protein